MDVEFSSAKKNRGWMSGLPTDSPRALFWDCKNSPGLYEMDHKCPCVLALELFDVNGLVCVELDRLIHDSNVLTQLHNYIKYNCVCRPLEMILRIAQVSYFGELVDQRY